MTMQRFGAAAPLGQRARISRRVARNQSSTADWRAVEVSLSDAVRAPRVRRDRRRRVRVRRRRTTASSLRPRRPRARGTISMRCCGSDTTRFPEGRRDVRAALWRTTARLLDRLLEARDGGVRGATDARCRRARARRSAACVRRRRRSWRAQQRTRISSRARRSVCCASGKRRSTSELKGSARRLQRRRARYNAAIGRAFRAASSRSSASFRRCARSTSRRAGR